MLFSSKPNNRNKPKNLCQLPSFFKCFVKQGKYSKKNQEPSEISNEVLENIDTKKTEKSQFCASKSQTIILPNTENVNRTKDNEIIITPELERRVFEFLFPEQTNNLNTDSSISNNDVEKFTFESFSIQKSQSTVGLTKFSESLVFYKPVMGENKFLDRDNYSFEEDLEITNFNYRNSFFTFGEEVFNNYKRFKLFDETGLGNSQKSKSTEVDNFKSELKIILQVLSIEILEELEYGFYCKYTIELLDNFPFKPNAYFEASMVLGNIRFKKISGDEKMVCN
ncbi:hypothetical protein HK099_001603 [Clydaea vesicula]|uniref:Uncharacterized protein n=1 Tax=Clydaea vesicula TaxID=447962 RepID=A0AAD5U3B9_9FUNG|nr:hypothetical protein HK099_001603 [Clydaea vesicula]